MAEQACDILAARQVLTPPFLFLKADSVVTPQDDSSDAQVWPCSGKQRTSSLTIHDGTGGRCYGSPELGFVPVC